MQADHEQTAIRRALGAQPDVDPNAELAKRRDFLVAQMRQSGQHALVLGISGGVDSTVAGRICQLAAERARDEGIPARFFAMRLPYGEQRDEADAQRALAFIAPDQTLTTDIRPASDALVASLEKGGLAFRDAAHRDFVLGNIKARQRMVAQYAVAGTCRGLVVGTDHAAEALMGFFTKFGDGACDVAPLSGLTKGQVRRLGAVLGAPRELVEKVPTADLETLAPLRPDEAALGVRYEEIDAFLEGREVSEQARRTIIETYRRTEHKRQLPLDPNNHASA